MMRGSTLSELAVEYARISSSFRMRIRIQMLSPHRRATIPSTTSAKNRMAKCTRSTSFASGHREAKPKFATVTAISANTPTGA